MPLQQNVIDDTEPDWEERYRLLFERYELFLQKICAELKLEFTTTSENDILQEIESIRKFLKPLIEE